MVRQKAELQPPEAEPEARVCAVHLQGRARQEQGGPTARSSAHAQLQHVGVQAGDGAQGAIYRPRGVYVPHQDDGRADLKQKDGCQVSVTQRCCSLQLWP